MKKHLVIVGTYFTTLTPVVALAQGNNFASLVGIAVGMVKSLIPLVIALSLLYFSWGLFQLIKTNNEGSREDAIKMMTYGIVALFVMVGVWGLVQVLTSTFFGGAIPAIPQLR